MSGSAPIPAGETNRLCDFPSPGRNKQRNPAGEGRPPPGGSSLELLPFGAVRRRTVLAATRAQGCGGRARPKGSWDRGPWTERRGLESLGVPAGHRLTSGLLNSWVVNSWAPVLPGFPGVVVHLRRTRGGRVDREESAWRLLWLACLLSRLHESFQMRASVAKLDGKNSRCA